MIGKASVISSRGSGDPIEIRGATNQYTPRLSRAISAYQMLLLFVVLVASVVLLLVTVDTALVSTLFLLSFVTFVGLWLCQSTQRSLGDPKLKVLGTFWIIKIFLTLFLLYAGWIPQLDPDSGFWGYDPQRYYADAWVLVQNNFITGGGGLTYKGILFYYAVIFYLFGHNPVVPALVNAFVTLMGTLFLIRCAYQFAPDRRAKDWWIAGLLLVPEVVWFDVMTSRETLMGVLIITASLALGRHLVELGRYSFRNSLLLAVTSLGGILAVRTSMIVPLSAIFLALVLVTKTRSEIKALMKIALILFGVGALVTGPLVQSLIGGANVDYQDMIQRMQSFETNVAREMEWSDNSIGLLLAPNNTLESLAFLPPRMLLYLAAPIPNVNVSVTSLIDGSYQAWQTLTAFMTTVIFLLGFPYVIAGTYHAWRFRKRFSAPLIIPLTFWIVFVAVAGGNIIIHERYRLMFTLLLFATMWWGYTRCKPHEVTPWRIAWYGLLLASSILALSYKLLH